MMILSGVLLWHIVYKGQIEITTGVLEELQNNNLVNLFVSPLTFREWVASFLALGLIKVLVGFIFGSLITLLLYNFGIVFYSVHLLAFMGLLILSGWWLGFLVASFILRFGTRIQVLAWTFVWLASPFSAVFYPIECRVGVQIISRFIPMSYVFQEADISCMKGLLIMDNLESV
jgi:ABC-2 type transport system permease protein